MKHRSDMRGILLLMWGVYLCAHTGALGDPDAAWDFTAAETPLVDEIGPGYEASPQGGVSLDNTLGAVFAVPGNALLSLPNRLTLSPEITDHGGTWRLLLTGIRFDTVNADTQTLFQCRSAAAGLQVRLLNSNLQASVWADTLSDWAAVDSGITPSVGEDLDLSISWDGTNLAVVVGAASNSVAVSNPLVAHDRPIELGGDGLDMTSFFDGSIRGAAFETTPPALPAGLTGDWALPADKSKLHIFLLMGQSNMKGYGGAVAGDPWQAEDFNPVPGVVVLEGQSHVSDPALDPALPMNWHLGVHPLHNRPSSGNFGLGLDFARQYRAVHTNVTVGLIPAAWGGEEIDDLNKGSILYSNAIDRADMASLRGTIKGVLWHQGESDTVSAAFAYAYADKLEQLVADLRDDLLTPELRVVVGNLAEFYGTGPAHNAPARVVQIKTVRAALRGLAAQDALVAFVETTGLNSPDAHMVHFDRQSYIALGQRYAEALMGVSAPQPNAMATHAACLTTNSTVIFNNISLSSVLNAHGSTMGGSSINDPDPAASVFHFTNDGATATYQLQVVQDGHTKCVKVQLDQSGPDIAAKVVYAKVLLNQSQLGYDFDTGGSDVTIATSSGAIDYGAATTAISYIYVSTNTEHAHCLTPVATKYSNVYNANRVPANLFNATGMNGTETVLYNLDGTIVGEPTSCDGVSWMTSNYSAAAATEGRVWIVMDLGASYALGNLDIWNFQWNHIGINDLSDRAISQFDVFVRNTDADTDDGTGSGSAINVSGVGNSVVTAPVFDLGTSDQWQLALSDQPLAQAPNNDTYTAPTFDLSGNTARFVAIRADSGYAGACFGLGKVRIHQATAPTPATLIFGR